MAFPTGIVDALDPSRLRLIAEVQRRGSISSAAEACRMSQPSATKHLKTLEAALGEQLVERNGRASQLTEAGAIVADHGARVLDTLEGMRESLQALRDAELGTLSLAASTTPGTYVLPAILSCFAESHPGVDVEIEIGSSQWVAERVHRREVSIGIAGEAQLPSGVRSEPFLDDEIVGVAAAGRVKTRRGRVATEAIAEETLLCREAGSSTRLISDRYLARAGLQPSKRWELDSNEAIKRAVQAGLGVGFLSERVVADEIGRGELMRFSLEGVEPMPHVISLLLPSDRSLRPSERAFVETLGDCCAVSISGCLVGGGEESACE